VITKLRCTKSWWHQNSDHQYSDYFFTWIGPTVYCALGPGQSSSVCMYTCMCMYLDIYASMSRRFITHCKLFIEVIIHVNSIQYLIIISFHYSIVCLSSVDTRGQVNLPRQSSGLVFAAIHDELVWAWGAYKQAGREVGGSTLDAYSWIGHCLHVKAPLGKITILMIAILMIAILMIAILMIAILMHRDFVHCSFFIVVWGSRFCDRGY